MKTNRFTVNIWSFDTTVLSSNFFKTSKQQRNKTKPGSTDI